MVSLGRVIFGMHPKFNHLKTGDYLNYIQKSSSDPAEKVWCPLEKMTHVYYQNNMKQISTLYGKV
jgi:hypothetical protein